MKRKERRREGENYSKIKIEGEVIDDGPIFGKREREKGKKSKRTRERTRYLGEREEEERKMKRGNGEKRCKGRRKEEIVF